MGHVSEIWRYPVKSMLGERLDRASLTPNGLLGDRGWALRDEVRGGMRGAKKLPGLMRFGARYLDEPTPERPSPPVEITLPDGSTTGSGDVAVNEKVSAALGHETTLWPLRPRTDLEHYRRGAPDHDDVMDELRSIFGRTPDEPLPDLGIFPLELIEYESPPGSYVDAFPLLILTTGSMRTLARHAPDSAIDVRRFRPNVLVDTGDEEGWPEMDWLGRRFRLGTATVEVYVGCPRCVMVTHEVAGLPGDREVLRTIVREADQNLGVYATIVEPGAFGIGDELVAL